MKILIAYDGSTSSDEAIEDLQKAGFKKKNVDVLVVSVAEVWMPPKPSSNGNGFVEKDHPEILKEWNEEHAQVAKSAIYEAEALNRHAKEQILNLFPDWKVLSKAVVGSPGREILSQADEFAPDLIIVGSQGRNAIGRILLGSVSLKVLSEAGCSVRVARGKIKEAQSPLRIMIGFDGSPGSKLAIEAVSSRNWGADTEVCLLSAIQSFMPTTIGRFVPPVPSRNRQDFSSQRRWMEKISESSLQQLQHLGLKTELKIAEGNPKDVLIEHSNTWKAESIFVGAHSYSGDGEQSKIGTTSAAVAERASCSVECVRQLS